MLRGLAHECAALGRAPRLHDVMLDGADSVFNCFALAVTLLD